MGFTISFAGADKYTGPFEGSSVLFPWDGATYGDITEIETAKSKGGNDMLVFTLVAKEPGAEGLTIKKYVPVSGMRSDGVPNVFALLDVIASVVSAGDGVSDDDAVSAAQGLSGEQLTDEELKAKCLGKRAYFTVRAAPYDRKDGTKGWSSSVENMILRSSYESRVPNQHSPLPAEATNRSSGASSGAAKAPAVQGQASAPATANGAAPAKRASKFL